jgi:DNA-binding XRE family transcriptional regulator
MEGEGDLPPEAAQKILSADFRNIVKKVREGKTLSQAELARVQSRAAKAKDESVAWAKTTTELAQVLGVTRQSLNRWRKLEGAPKPRSNGLHPVVEWRQFMKARGLEGTAPSADMDALKARKLLAEIEDRELRTAVRKGEYVAIDQVRVEWTTQVGKAVALLRSKFENELPPVLVGLDAVAIQEECRRAIDEVCASLNEGGAVSTGS